MQNNKHTKHDDQKCKNCDDIFTSSMELVMHVAMKHSNSNQNYIIKPREQLDQSNELKEAEQVEQHDFTKCVMCKEKITEKNTTKIQGSMCSCALCAVYCPISKS